MTARCKYGGSVPCVDSLCHGSDTTLCGLTLGIDCCEHGNEPDLCDACVAEEDEWWDGPIDYEELALLRADEQRDEVGR